jgi:hypothetical protein
MPKATLTFQLPEEQAEFHMATSAGDVLSAVEELRATFRSRSKYLDGDDHKTDWTEAYQLVCEILQGIE